MFRLHKTDSNFEIIMYVIIFVFCIIQIAAVINDCTQSETTQDKKLSWILFGLVIYSNPDVGFKLVTMFL